jgi:hypothetical protein
MAQRIYLVTTPDNKVRLVKASVKTQALMHVAQSTFSVRVASQEDLVTALGNGTAVESTVDQPVL